MIMGFYLCTTDIPPKYVQYIKAIIVIHSYWFFRTIHMMLHNFLIPGFERLQSTYVTGVSALLARALHAAALGKLLNQLTLNIAH